MNFEDCIRSRVSHTIWSCDKPRKHTENPNIWFLNTTIPIPLIPHNLIHIREYQNTVITLRLKSLNQHLRHSLNDPNV